MTSSVRVWPAVPRLIDGLWLLILMGFVVAGLPLATFHGDEAMQIYTSHDYAIAFIERSPERLTTAPPYPIDSDPHLRILNGTINRHTIGLSWHLAGLTTGDLPPRPGWDWGLSYPDNVATAHRPSDLLLNVSRVSSTVLLALSVGVLFALGWQFGARVGTPRRRVIAYLASGLYALNPVILLNGRRAMQEGSLLFFGLLTILIAAIISRRRAAGQSDSVGWWALLALSGGLTLASKHSGIVFVIAALVWVGAAELTRLRWRALVAGAARLAVSAVLIAGLFLLLSPALWNDPLARVGDLLAVRAELLDIQVAVEPAAPLTLTDRITAIFTQPFVTAPAHFEVAHWGEVPAVQAEIARYMAAPLSGLQFGPLIGGALTALSVGGLIILLRRIVGPADPVARALAAGLIAWVGLTALSMLVNPLPWQRYYLPLIPAMTLLASVGVGVVLHRFCLQTAAVGQSI
ncbi:MAG: phospholipid carrier-dependent glycosyltransferase [Chloroflexi bacterium]|nr:phospholipid carrier-dependent glycosyltransferase [Chloroflexota bacterium]